MRAAGAARAAGLFVSVAPPSVLPMGEVDLLAQLVVRGL